MKDYIGRLLLLLLILPIYLTSCKEGSPKVVRPPATVVQQIPKTANPPLDKSVMDISYFPSDFPVKKMGGVEKGNPIARVIYSRPGLDGRRLFGDVIRYGRPWRLGANEATEIEFFRNVKIMGNNIAAGRYVIYCIPFEDKWTIKLSKDLYTWGLKINPDKDVLSVDVPVQPLGFKMEYLSIQFVPADQGTALRISWENVKVELLIQT